MTLDPACACAGGAAIPGDPLPGLSRIGWRIGTHASFQGAMLDRLHRAPALAGLTTRDPGDPAIALLDSWAVALDILAFYNERIVNEGFLRPATERRSVLELARLIGYAPSPGVSASTFLAVLCDTIPGSPDIVTLPAGTGIMSIPKGDEKPQIFETDAAIAARPAWQDLRTMSVHYVAPRAGNERVMLHPPTELRIGDMLLITGDERRADTESLRWQARRVAAIKEVAADTINQVPPRTEVTLEAALGPHTAIPLQSPRVLALRQRANIFGHNAQPWDALPVALRVGDFLPLAMQAEPKMMALKSIVPDEAADETNSPFVMSLDLGELYSDLTLIDFDEKSALVKGLYADRRSSWADANFPASRDYVDLDQVHDRFVAGSWVVLRADNVAHAYQVTRTAEVSVTDFGMSQKVTRLYLRGPSLAPFSPRTTSVFGVSEQLAWGQTPIATPVAGREITLARAVSGLVPGQRIAVTGTNSVTGLPHAQIMTLDTISSVPGGGDAAMLSPPGVTTTRLRTTADLGASLVPHSVRINANVVAASHGETREDVIGSGNTAVPFQAVALPQKPLTFVSAVNSAGRASTLRVRVGGSWWTEMPSLVGAGPRDRRFVTRTANDGSVTIQFGDGTAGARPSSGNGNIVARYRVGTGLAGMLAAGQLTQPLQRPAGIAGVTNPLPTGGAEEPETLDSARNHAPLTVRAMGRIVSLSDVSDFARGFAGIGKAEAQLIRERSSRQIVLTIADARGNVPQSGDELFANLDAAILGARSGGDYAGQRHGLAIAIAGYRPAHLALNAELVLQPGAVVDATLTAARGALLSAFGFAARSFAQPASLAEAAAVLHGVAGVRAVRFLAFHRTDAATGVSPVLAADSAALSAAGPVGAELLSIDPARLLLTEVA